MTMLAEVVDVVIGVDTHKHTHTAAVVAVVTGAVAEEATVSADPGGYAELVAMAGRHSTRRAWSVEGAGSYGAGLARFLAEAGETVIEVERPGRPPRRGGKSDPLDAARAAREALAREHNAQPRAGGERAALAVAVSARRSAVEASTAARNQLHALITAAPEEVRCRFRGLTARATIDTAARLRTSSSWDLEAAAYAQAMRAVARRARALRDEAASHQEAILAIISTWRPDLLEGVGIGPITAATILCAWSHPGRCRNEAAFASLAGVNPIPASSGQTVRHRLNRSGDRRLNAALHTIAMHRMRRDPTTRAYVERRRAEGKTDREIRRSLKRYIARQLYRQLQQPLDAQ